MIYLLPLITVFIWGGNAIVNKMAAATIDPGAMSFHRWLVAMLIMTPFCLPKVLKHWPTIRPYLSKLAILALLGMAINQSLGYYAGLTTSASNMALISSLVPLISVFFAVPLLKKRLSKLTLCGASISLWGLAYMLGKGDVMFIFHQAPTQGDVLMVITAVVYAAYCVLLKKWKMPLSNWTLIYMQGFFAMVMLAPLCLLSDDIIPSNAALPLIFYAALGASVIAPWLWIQAIDKIGPESTSMFMNLLPVVAVTLATTFLGETFHRYHLVGGLMVITGVILSQIKWRTKRHHINPKDTTPTPQP
ncbi:DMT family transporter [Vibrio sp. SM6]|uniref:DMT family transporter n=1 Tax=Vibrio agarilyticus TaxID=2726741 RepID=A0A7X8YFC4_9VIBR|nr:DMT family transporter [Vibrio agarilyticus]NLS11738.1 DMT family transporter [Vibrio agarilyticus]